MTRRQSRWRRAFDPFRQPKPFYGSRWLSSPRRQGPRQEKLCSLEMKFMVFSILQGTIMAYQFPPDVEKLVKQQMITGAYQSEDDLLRDALHALEVQKVALIEEDAVVIDGVRRGLADLNAGRSQPLVEFDAEFRSRHKIPRDA
jgi:Arc/MetJ-type ribon-helix-helix transcriptional regulator